MLSRLFTTKKANKEKDLESIKKGYRENWGYNKRKAKRFLDLWDELYLPVIEKAISCNDYRQFFKVITSSDMPESEESKAMSRVREVALVFIARIEQVSDANRYYVAASHRYVLSEQQMLSLKAKQHELCLQEVKQAKSIQILKDTLENATVDTEAFLEGIDKWIDWCESVEEIKELRCFAVNKYSFQTRHPTIEKIDKTMEAILLREVPKTKNLERAKELFMMCDKMGATKLFAFETWLELCQIAEQANEAFDWAPKQCKMKAYKKVKELAYREAEQTSNE